ncbi:MAG: adenosylmethionine--8-amino-7-oxononanoate transaminase [Alphaproteobacteria bacterium]|nr:adenosylmethionine--8-amino-7-oxononanoate transaminase [Alphaproteobacteria bacterium]MBU0794128.1 adenosylmethionine--8-amino-7-oxononanoate transaminase [Alphaproteobacteria bacterium]MBU0876729.1 adenosylmethionine--8-amino-7-oxononanoate transaminase [Alphaproteobacteria bacterium]MBU1769431.1 adenosylmethionine--8-amino-7-oxononanoate transaminase [Alphaproteobacteria bacterium]
MSSPVWHPFTQHGLGEPIPQIASASGAWLSCDDGSRLLDCISSWWVITHGHCEPRIAAAIAEQAATLDQVIFAGYTHPQAEALARSLVALAPAGLDHVFFSDSGSTAVEVALKMALGHWHNRGEARHRILVLEHGYHGDTIGTMSVGARGVFNRAYEPLLFDVQTVPFPVAGQEKASLDALESFCRAADKPAAFIVEPLVLGAGGMLFYPPEVLRAFSEICAQHDVLFIVDEVMTGWGRTGTLFACEQARVEPDILCLAKGLTGGSVPLAATLASAAIFESHRSMDRAAMFFHSSSFTANPVCCAAANANLAIWQEEDVPGRISALGHALDEGLASLAGHRRLHDARRIGAIAAIDILVPDGGYLSDVALRLRAYALANGLLLRPLGNTIYLMPPYCTTRAEIAQAFAVIADAVDTLPD